MRVIKKIVSKVLPTVVVNAVGYFIRGNVRQFESLAEKDDKPQTYVDGYVSKFDAPETKLMFDKTVSLLFKLIPLFSEDCSVLDVGCGTGRYLAAIRAAFPDAQLYGLDASENTVKNYSEKVAGVRCVCCDLSSDDNPFKDVTFDFVYSITVIQYIPFFKIKGFISRISAMIKPGGIFVLQFPQSKTGGLSLVSNLNYTRYPPPYICNILRNNGFQILESDSLDSTDTQSEHMFGHYVVAQKNKDIAIQCVE